LFSNLFEMILRYLIFASVLIILASFALSSFRLWMLLSLVLFSPGLRSYLSYTRNWLRLKSAKYNFQVYLYGIYLLEATRISYIKGYIKGYFYSTSYQKEQAELLKKRLAVYS